MTDGGQFHWDPATYLSTIRAEVPDYDDFEAAVAAVSSLPDARRLLDLGTGSGETARRVLAANPGAELVGIDENADMLAGARSVLPTGVDLRVGKLEDGLPDGPFDLVVSALAVHHLEDTEKQALFRRVHRALAPSGRFVLGDVVVPRSPEDQRTPIERGVDLPSPAAEQLVWLGDTGFSAFVSWERADLVVIVAEPV